MESRVVRTDPSSEIRFAGISFWSSPRPRTVAAKLKRFSRFPELSRPPLPTCPRRPKANQLPLYDGDDSGLVIVAAGSWFALAQGWGQTLPKGFGFHTRLAALCAPALPGTICPTAMRPSKAPKTFLYDSTDSLVACESAVTCISFRAWNGYTFGDLSMGVQQWLPFRAEA